MNWTDRKWSGRNTGGTRCASSADLRHGQAIVWEHGGGWFSWTLAAVPTLHRVDSYNIRGREACRQVCERWYRKHVEGEG